MKVKWAAWLLCLMLLISGAAARADQQVVLPDGIHCLTLPEGMIALPVDPTLGTLTAVYGSGDLEIEIFLYSAGDANMTELAQALTANGRETEIRENGGVEMLVYRDQDEADGALCIGYMYRAEDYAVEICFWYSTTEAGEQSRRIMETFREWE